MVFSAKMLLKSGIPSAGQPAPVNGLQFGDEYGRRPTSVTWVGLVGVITHPAGCDFPYGHGMFVPFGPPGMYGIWKVIPAGIVREYALSDEKVPQLCPGMLLMSRQVWGLP